MATVATIDAEISEVQREIEALTKPLQERLKRLQRLRAEANPSGEELSQRVLAYLREHPDSSGSEIADGLGITGGAISRALKEVVNEVVVRRDGHAKRWRRKADA